MDIIGPVQKIDISVNNKPNQGEISLEEFKGDWIKPGLESINKRFIFQTNNEIIKYFETTKTTIVEACSATSGKTVIFVGEKLFPSTEELLLKVFCESNYKLVKKAVIKGLVSLMDTGKYKNPKSLKDIIPKSYGELGRPEDCFSKKIVELDPMEFRTINPPRDN